MYLFFQHFIYRNPDEKDLTSKSLIDFYNNEIETFKNFNSKIIQSNNLIKSKIKKLLKIG